VALIDTGPSLDAFMPQSLLSRLLLTELPGRLLWHLLRSDGTVRKAMRTAFTRQIEIPDAIIEDVLGMTHRALAATSHASDDYLRQRSVPERLAALGIPVLVVFGADDQRWRSSSAAAYRVVPDVRVELLPGVGHTPMLEDPQATGKLLLEFVAAAASACPSRR
jgi:pimeloyl-ACP methyl ester carboxylesterase